MAKRSSPGGRAPLNRSSPAWSASGRASSQLLAKIVGHPQGSSSSWTSCSHEPITEGRCTGACLWLRSTTRQGPSWSDQGINGPQHRPTTDPPTSWPLPRDGMRKTASKANWADGQRGLPGLLAARTRCRGERSRERPNGRTPRCTERAARVQKPAQRPLTPVPARCTVSARKAEFRR